LKLSWPQGKGKDEPDDKQTLHCKVRGPKDENTATNRFLETGWGSAEKTNWSHPNVRLTTKHGEGSGGKGKSSIIQVAGPGGEIGFLP